MSASSKLSVIFLLLIIAFSSGAYYLMQQTIDFTVRGINVEPFSFRLGGNEIIGWNKGEMVWRVIVNTIIEPPLEQRSRLAQQKVILRDISDGWFYSDGEVLFDFLVEEAFYNMQTENLELMNFRMETPLGDWMETLEMHYEKATETLTAPGKVVGKIAGADFTAGSMVVYLENDEIVLKDGVNIEIDVEGIRP